MTMYLLHADWEHGTFGVLHEQTSAEAGASPPPFRNMTSSAGGATFSQTGFTLVEMLLVLAIIALSAALVGPAVHTVVTRYQRQVASAEEAEEGRMEALQDFARDLPLHDSVLYRPGSVPE